MPLYTDAELEKLLNDTAIDGVPFDGIGSSGLGDLSDLINAITTGTISEEIGDFLEDGLTKFGARYRGPNLHFYTDHAPQESGDEYFEPKKLYFYYLKFDENGALICRVFSDEINKIGAKTGPDIEDRIKTEIKTKISIWLKAPLCQREINTNDLEALTLDNIGWNKPCYLAFMLDAEGWELFQSHSGNNAIHFSKQPTVGGQATCSNKFNCFCNSFIDTVNGSRPILFVANRHISNTTGQPRKDYDTTKDLYKFDLFYRVSTNPKTYSDPENPTPETEKKLTLIIDPTGTNFGPP